MKSGETTNKEKGDEGETLAAKFLEEKGYTVLEKNWVSYRFEIDIIASDKTHIVFVEVKLRYSNTYGEPWEAVNRVKRKKIMSSANHYISLKKISREPRFDIVSIIKSGNSTRIEHITDAFYPFA